MNFLNMPTGFEVYWDKYKIALWLPLWIYLVVGGVWAVLTYMGAE